ncbi:MAG: hypothetical protein AAFY33_08870 [Cyanobacteria bacterium J06643_4]
MTPRRRSKQPLDSAALMTMAVLSVVIAAMLLLGSQALPRVRTFSWQDKPVAAEDIAFLLTFTRPMDPQSVMENLVIEPELPGKVSWAGRRMAYTLNRPAPYGQSFEISLPTAQSLIGQEGFEPFEESFATRDRVFAYIGAEGEEQGRLVMFNLTQKEKTLLTPEGQIVLDFQPYPARDRILFSAISEKDSANRVSSAQLYTVSTGLGSSVTPPKWKLWQQASEPVAGTTTLILDNERYQNLKFDLSADGTTIVVQRVNQTMPSDFGPWVLKEGEAPRKLETEPGGDFTIAPDSVSLLLQQGEGTAVLSLEPNLTAAESDELLDFLPDYGLTLDIASDGRSAALVNFNQDDPEKRFTQSLFWVSNSGEEKPLLETDGAILSAQFNDSNDLLYCLVNRLVKSDFDQPTDSEDDAQGDELEPSLEASLQASEVPAEPDFPEDALIEAQTAEEALIEDGKLGEEDVFQFTPYLTVVNVDTGEETKLLEMPPQPEINVSLSPDGLAILFDEVLVSDAQAASSSGDYEGPTHRLWLLPLFSAQSEQAASAEPVALPPTALEIAGQRPAWLP